LNTPVFRVREVMDAVLKCVRQNTIKCVQQVPGPRYRSSFRSFEYKQLFLDQPFHLRGERVIAQELDYVVFMCAKSSKQFVFAGMVYIYTCFIPQNYFDFV
jgi:hypothetical protein